MLPLAAELLLPPPPPTAGRHVLADVCQGQALPGIQENLRRHGLQVYSLQLHQVRTLAAIRGLYCLRAAWPWRTLAAATLLPVLLPMLHRLWVHAPLVRHGL